MVVVHKANIAGSTLIRSSLTITEQNSPIVASLGACQRRGQPNVGHNKTEVRQNRALRDGVGTGSSAHSLRHRL